MPRLAPESSPRVLPTDGFDGLSLEEGARAAAPPRPPPASDTLAMPRARGERRFSTVKVSAKKPRAEWMDV